VCPSRILDQSDGAFELQLKIFEQKLALASVENWKQSDLGTLESGFAEERSKDHHYTKQLVFSRMPTPVSCIRRFLELARKHSGLGELWLEHIQKLTSAEY
jgi:hypothetical protein